MIRELVISMTIAMAMALTGTSPIFAADVVKLSPEKVVELAKTQSIAVQVSEWNVKSMEQSKKSAFKAFFPSLGASASAMHVIDKAQFELGGGGNDSLVLTPAQEPYRPIIEGLMSGFSNLKIETPDNLYNAGFTIGQPLFTGGRIKNAYRSAEFSLNAQKWTHERMLKEMSFSALQLFWLYVNTLKQIEALKETRQWFETMIGDQQKMFEQGLIIELDVLNSKIQLDNTKLGQMKLENGLATVGGNLLLFLNLPLDGNIEADTTALSAALSPFSAASEDLFEKAVDNREDVIALMNQIEALKAMMKIQAAAYCPSINAIYNFAYTNQYSTRENDMKKSSEIGAALNWNIFDWGKGLNDKKSTEYKIKGLELQLENLRKQIQLKIRELGRKVEESVQVFDIARKDLEIARKSLEIAQKKYDAQAITNTELLNARNQLTGKMVAYTQARINVILAAEEFKVAPLGSGSAQQTQ
jgi:outer membrane protein TolC